jgi:L-lactate dehydrogenase (cytochrome)
VIVTIDDLRRKARWRLPRAVFDFIDGAAEDELTLRRNRAALRRITFRPRALVDASHLDQSTTVLGQSTRTPLILAPTGLCGMAAPRGEIPSARAAVAQGTIFTLSTMSGVTIEDTMREAPGPHWFQLYVWRDRDLTKSLIDRAKAAGYKALVLTVDVQMLGQRERDLRNGATIPPRITIRNALESAIKVRWLMAMARAPRPEFVNVAGAVRQAKGAVLALGEFVNSQYDPSVDWEDLAWFRRQWSGPLAVKGIMSAEDAVRAVDAGVDAIVVSNHGGRQLDGLPATIEVLPEVVDAVNGRAEVLFDGGIRRGSDAVKAIALGARACLIGRAYLSGLAVEGQYGVERAIGILRAEIARVLTLLGRPSLAELDRSALNLPLPAHW